jgi:hypothetical protein
MALPENRAIPLRKFPEKVRRFVDPEAPEQLKDMLARGLVPMKPLVQVCALYQLHVLESDKFGSDVTATLRRLPIQTVKQITTQPLQPVVLDWLSKVFTDADIIRTILLNRLTDDETIARLARTAVEDQCELIARNQIRLLRAPELVETLYFNRNTRASTADRILDFAARNDLSLPNIPHYKDVVAAIRGEMPTSTAEAEAADQAFRDAQDALAEMTGSKSDEHLEAAGNALADDLGPEAANQDGLEEHEQEEVAHAAKKIRELNVSQKVRLALMGTAGDRAVLIRDANKLVSRTVVRSPAVTDSEAIGYAKNKSLADEVIAYIAGNKKWTRHYQVKFNLVMNPKTPLSDSLKFLPHLRLNDLRALARSRDVPGPVRKAAKNMMRNRLN